MGYQLLHTLDPHIFRAYDIRGETTESFKADAVYTIARALGTLLKRHGHTSINTARDGRLSGPQLHAALNAGLRESGCDVVDFGMLPSPVLYFACAQSPVSSGVVLTGSHNPANYNGLKMIMDGCNLSSEHIQDLYTMILAGDIISGQGSYTTQNIQAQYCREVTSIIDLKRRIKVVIDCGNGATGEIAPRLFEQMGCEVIALYSEVDGRFPNHHPDPTEEQNLVSLKDAVKRHQADIGIGFDGDGDRLGVVTHRGECIFADRLLMLYAAEILSRKPDSTIVFDVKCTQQLTPWILQHAGNPVMYKTGHSLIKNKMKEVNAELAGEMSGHIFFHDRWYGFDDAMYAAARLLEILSQGLNAGVDIFANLPTSINTPELKIPMKDEYKFEFINDFIAHAEFSDANMNLLDGIRVEYSDGWGLLRASNTTPCLVLRFEADSHRALERIQSDFKNQLRKLDPGLHFSF